MSVGENIKNLRIKNNITQIELSNRIGVTQSMLCQLERGSKALNIQLAKQIADFFCCSVDDLLKD